MSGRGSGTNHIARTTGGTAIEERFKITDGRSKGFEGTSISLYHERFDVWKQAWADSQGTFYYFKGWAEGNDRIFQTEVCPASEGREITQRMVFRDITTDPFTWDWGLSEDGGTSWKLMWRIHYTRRS